MKTFLLIAGSAYYPQSGTDDWVGCFKTAKEARKRIKTETINVLFQRGSRKGQVKETFTKQSVLLNDGNLREIDWYEIVDIGDWIDIFEDVDYF